MTNSHGKHILPPKTCTIERLVTKPSDVKKVLAGKKTSARRNGRYADAGDVMILHGRRFVVEKVYQQKLGELTEEDAKKEGYDSAASYKDAILAIHPGMKWVPKMKVWVHEFTPIEKETGSV